MKYELTDQTISNNGVTFYRVRALKSFGNVVEGQVGGFVAGYPNLSQSGNCWVADDAVAFGNYCVCGDEVISGSMVVYSDNNFY